MINIFRTADTGKEYAIKSNTLQKKVFNNAASTFTPGVVINWPNQLISTLPYAQSNVVTSKKILPLYYSLTYYGKTTGNTFIMSTPYSVSAFWNTGYIASTLVPLSKIIPYCNQATNPIIGFEWNNIDWNENDFIDPTNGIQVEFDVSPENCMNFIPSTITIPNDANYSLISTAFLYAELQ
jgi:hypothetical protein